MGRGRGTPPGAPPGLPGAGGAEPAELPGQPPVRRAKCRRRCPARRPCGSPVSKAASDLSVGNARTPSVARWQNDCRYRAGCRMASAFPIAPRRGRVPKRLGAAMGPARGAQSSSHEPIIYKPRLRAGLAVGLMPRERAGKVAPGSQGSFRQAPSERPGACLRAVVANHAAAAQRLPASPWRSGAAPTDHA